MEESISLSSEFRKKIYGLQFRLYVATVDSVSKDQLRELVTALSDVHADLHKLWRQS